MQAGSVSTLAASVPEGAPGGALGLATFSRVEAVVVDAVSLAQALHGSSHVSLSGFHERDVQLPAWTHPGVAQVVATESAQDALQQMVADRRRLRGMTILAGALIAFSAFCVGALAASWLRVSGGSAAAPSLAWTVVDASDAGLVLTTPAGRVVVPAGGKLPNGDAVLAVDAKSREVRLTSGVLRLPPPPGLQPASHSAPAAAAAAPHGRPTS